MGRILQKYAHFKKEFFFLDDCFEWHILFSNSTFRNIPIYINVKYIKIRKITEM